MRKPIVLGIALLAATAVATPAANASAPAGRESTRQSVQKAVGNVVSVNPRTHMIIVAEKQENDSSRTVAFTMDDRGKIRFQDMVGRLDELKAGDIVTVSYHMHEGRYLADEVEVARKARPAPPVTKPKS